MSATRLLSVLGAALVVTAVARLFADGPASALAPGGEVAALSDKLRGGWAGAKSSAERFEVTRALKADLLRLGELARNDAAAEEALRQLALLTPKGGFEETFLPGLAEQKLAEIHAQSRYDDIVRGAANPSEELKKIDQALDAHPEWVRPRLRAEQRNVRELDQLVPMLVMRAEALGGAAEIGHLVDAEWVGPGSAVRYKDALIAYAASKDIQWLSAGQRLIDYLAYTRDAKAMPVLQKWLTAALRVEGETQGVLIRELIASMSQLPGGQEELTRLLGNGPPAAVRAAAVALTRFANANTAQSLSEAVERARREHFPADDLDIIERMKKDVEEQLKHKGILTTRKAD